MCECSTHVGGSLNARVHQIKSDEISCPSPGRYEITDSRSSENDKNPMCLQSRLVTDEISR